MAETFVAQARKIDSAQVKEVVTDGRAYLIAPMIAARAGVMNKYLVPADELGKFVDAWNDAPIPVHHPKVNGLHVSARAADQIEQSIGRLYDVTFDDGLTLKGMAKIDIQKAERLGGDALIALSALRSGKPVEVSTGYFCDIENRAGTHDGVEYVGIQRNIRPDHVALLPGETGACSWQDGCGIPRVNSDLRANLDASLNDTLRMVSDAWYSQFQSRSEVAMDATPSDSWVREVWADFVIARENRKLWRYDYTVDGTSVTFGSPVEVVVTYTAVATNKKDNGGSIVDTNIPAEGCNDCPPEGTPATSAPATNSGDTGAQGTPPSAGDFEGMTELRSLIDAVRELGGLDGLRQALADVKTNADAERNAMADSIVANSNGVFTRDDLDGLSVAHLRKMSAAFRPADYLGAGGPVTNRAGGDWTPYVTPSVEVQ